MPRGDEEKVAGWPYCGGGGSVNQSVN